MKTIGLLGGMSWESTASYYKAINEGVKQSMGGLHSAKICLYSVDFAEVELLQHQGLWDEAAVMLAEAAQRVEAGGADFLLICTNTMHKVADEIQAAISIPILHIADATAKRLKADEVKKVALLGTAFTMSQPFYKERLKEKYGLEVLVPNEGEQQKIHDIIYTELCLGEIKSSSRDYYLKVVDALHEQGAEAIILGCTEISLLIQQAHCSVPFYDTTEIHAQEAVLKALSFREGKVGIFGRALD